MSWEWEVLAAVVRFLFLLAPFIDISDDFSLMDDSLHEAREFALAGSCKALLVSFPAQLLLAILARAGQSCRTVNVLFVVVYVVAAFIVGYLLLRIPTKHLRGTVVPFIWFAVFETIGVMTQVFGLAPAVRSICQ